MILDYAEIDYARIELPEELLSAFAKALAPEIRSFYNSDEGKAYFEKWLTRHPEYANPTTDVVLSAV